MNLGELASLDYKIKGQPHHDADDGTDLLVWKEYTIKNCAFSLYHKEK